MKKLLALLLAAVMVLSMAACSNNQGSDDTTAGTDGTTAPAGEATYTYNTALSVFPTNWNVHTYRTDVDGEILDYIADGFYTFDYNETQDGYKVIPAMATDFPEDVTAEYVGQYGIKEGDTAIAHKITLRDDLKWEDGTPITAQDFIESAKRLLDPAAQNYRADMLYSGNMIVKNAKKYLNSGKVVELQDNNDNAEVFAVADLTKGEDGVYTTPQGETVYIALDVKMSWLQGKTLTDTVKAYGDTVFDLTDWDALVAKKGDNGCVPLTDETMGYLETLITGNPAWGETAENIPGYIVYKYTNPDCTWDEVGMLAPSDHELVLILEKPLSGFYLYYSLTSSWLVNIELYDSLATVKDGVYTNTYGTSAETTISYGPYKLTSFQADKQYVLEKNENYYGLTDDTYQTTKMVVDCVPEASTRLELFLQGKLDSYGLDATDMDTYSLSDYCYYATGDSTFAMVFNPDLENLTTAQQNAGANINKTILTIPEFRMAMSLALDRSAFCLATSPTNSAAFGLFSNMIISDPEAGTAYRTTDVAKEVLAEFWGVSEDYGEGKLYADLDEAVESITGYNLAMAQEKFNEAYDKAIEMGLMDEDDVVEIKIGTPDNTTGFYNNGYEFIVNNYTEAVKGTKLEGKLTFSRDDTLGNAYAEALQKNTVDLLFGVGWTGSALDPYRLIDAYVNPDYQYDAGTDYTAIQMDFEIDGVTYTASVADWNNVMKGDKVTLKAEDGSTIEYSCGTADNDPETRLRLLGAMEGAVLLNYNFIPVMDNSTAQLKGQQIEFYTEEYIFGMGFGGVKYYTYNYTDAEWDAYVASQNGELDYT